MTKAGWGKSRDMILAYCDRFLASTGRFPTRQEVLAGTGLSPSTLYPTYDSWRKAQKDEHRHPITFLAEANSSALPEGLLSAISAVWGALTAERKAAQAVVEASIERMEARLEAKNRALVAEIKVAVGMNPLRDEIGKMAQAENACATMAAMVQRAEERADRAEAAAQRQLESFEKASRAAEKMAYELAQDLHSAHLRIERLLAQKLALESEVRTQEVNLKKMRVEQGDSPSPTPIPPRQKREFRKNPRSRYNS